MAKIPDFDRIVATVTDADIEKFLLSAAPEDDKQRVRDAPTHEIRMRFVGGYLIRTNQIKPNRLKPVARKQAKPAKTVKTAKASGATAVATPAAN